MRFLICVALILALVSASIEAVEEVESRRAKQLRDIDSFFLGKDSSEEEDNDQDVVDKIRVTFRGAREIPQLAFAAQSIERSFKDFNR